ncbi:MAG: anhydro-N-acetylmuramic acid kinase [Bdellovibrionota bacterium]
MRKQLVIGIMNGTSLDGVDFVLTEIHRPSSAKKNPKTKFIAEKSFQFSSEMKFQLIKAARHELQVKDLARLHHDLGRFYAECYKKLPAKFKKAHLIGLHGQTVYHEAPRATLQIGESSYLSTVSGKTVVSDFRTADLSLGGQGAPIATLFHEKVLAGTIKTKSSVAIHNLGGISNLSLIGKKGVLLSFDTGPANMLLDLYIQSSTNGQTAYDDNGERASRGHVQSQLLSRMLEHEYLKSSPPKSCGREEFGESFLNRFKPEMVNLNLEDALCTLTAFTATTIVQAYRNFAKPMPEKIIFCGGGANNLFLLKRIQALLPNVKIQTSTELGWPVSSIEGAAFALLAAYRIWEIPSNYPKTTGAKSPALLGKITRSIL